MLSIKSLIHDIEQVKSVDDFIKYINNDFFNIKIFFQAKTVKEIYDEKFDLERLLFTLEDNKLISKNNSPTINNFLELLFNCFEILQFKSCIKILSSYLSLTETIYQIKANILFLNINNIKVDYHNRFDDILSLLDKSNLHQASQKTLLLYFFIGIKNFAKIKNNDLAQSFKSFFIKNEQQYRILKENTLQTIISQINTNTDYNNFFENLYTKPIEKLIQNEKNDIRNIKISNKIILIDLDGTLTNTAHVQYKLMKDGKVEINLAKIPIFEGAKEFIEHQKSINNKVIIVSDSHYKYVTKISHEIFNVASISLCDKPNINKIKELIDNDIELKSKFKQNREDFLFIGDTWLDIEVGRKLNIPTILVEFYNTSTMEIRDGIGNRLKHITMGATFYATNFQQLIKIINNPTDNLLALEGIFHNPKIDSIKTIPMKQYSIDNKGTQIVALGRQQQGECDKYAVTEQYFNIANENRSQNFIKLLAIGVENYLKSLSYQNKRYDIITYVTDKTTTQPKNKMKEIFDTIKTEIQHETLFEWSMNVEGSLRDRNNRQDRKKFVKEFLSVKDDSNLHKKNIIIIDDQITTGATAEILINQLRQKGAKNIIFIGLFSLISNVESEKKCPKCGKNLIIKIKRSDGSKFFSCVPPQYKGNGCGYRENINNE